MADREGDAVPRQFEVSVEAIEGRDERLRVARIERLDLVLESPASHEQQPT